jgi:hypothetical protein
MRATARRIELIDNLERMERRCPDSHQLYQTSPEQAADYQEESRPIEADRPSVELSPEQAAHVAACRERPLEEIIDD